MQVFAAAYQLAFITIVLVPLSLLLKDAQFAAIARIFGISVGIIGMLLDFSLFVKYLASEIFSFCLSDVHVSFFPLSCMHNLLNVSHSHNCHHVYSDSERGRRVRLRQAELGRVVALAHRFAAAETRSQASILLDSIGWRL